MPLVHGFVGKLHDASCQVKSLYRGHKVELELELGNQAPLREALNTETGNASYDVVYMLCYGLAMIDHGSCADRRQLSVALCFFAAGRLFV